MNVLSMVGERLSKDSPNSCPPSFRNPAAYRLAKIYYFKDSPLPLLHPSVSQALDNSMGVVSHHRMGSSSIYSKPGDD